MLVRGSGLSRVTGVPVLVWKSLPDEVTFQWLQALYLVIYLNQKCPAA